MTSWPPGRPYLFKVPALFDVVTLRTKVPIHSPFENTPEPQHPQLKDSLWHRGHGELVSERPTRWQDGISEPRVSWAQSIIYLPQVWELGELFVSGNTPKGKTFKVKTLMLKLQVEADIVARCMLTWLWHGVGYLGLNFIQIHSLVSAISRKFSIALWTSVYSRARWGSSVLEGWMT